VIVTIVGGSMAPGLPAGARVRVDPDDRAPAVGLVMLFRGRDGWIVHRVLAVSPARERVAHAGDAAWRFGLARTDDVAGRVVESVGPLPGDVLEVSELPPAARARYAWNALRARAALAARGILRR
jgi:hypothetical protein